MSEMKQESGRHSPNVGNNLKIPAELVPDFEKNKEELLKRCESAMSKRETLKGDPKMASKLRWAKIIGGLRAVIKLNKICKDIKTYGTSEELLNTKSRSTKAIAQAIDPSLDKYIKPDIPEELPFLILHPYGTVMRYWSIVLLLLFFYVAIIMPLKMAFFDDNLGWFYTDLIVDILFIIDIIICLNLAYFDSNENLVTSRKKIFLSYLWSWLLFDLAASFPSALLEMLTENSLNNDLLKLLRLPRLYKLIRVARLFKMYKIATKGGFFEKVQDYFRINTGMTRLFSFMFTVVICNHIAGCLWVYLAKMDSYSPGTWITRYGLLVSAIAATTKMSTMAPSTSSGSIGPTLPPLLFCTLIEFGDTFFGCCYVSLALALQVIHYPLP